MTCRRNTSPTPACAARRWARSTRRSRCFASIRPRGTEGFAPAGAWAHFAIHGTGIPTPNDLLRCRSAWRGGTGAGTGHRCEQRADAAGAEPRAVAMFANGAEGNTRPRDASDDAGMHSTGAPSRGAAGIVADTAGWRRLAQTVRGSTRTRASRPGSRIPALVGERLGAAALELFLSLGESLVADLRLSRMFEQVPLRGPDAPQGLCARARDRHGTGCRCRDPRNPLRGLSLVRHRAGRDGVRGKRDPAELRLLTVPSGRCRDCWRSS